MIPEPYNFIGLVMALSLLLYWSYRVIRSDVNRKNKRRDALDTLAKRINSESEKKS